MSNLVMRSFCGKIHTSVEYFSTPSKELRLGEEVKVVALPREHDNFSIKTLKAIYGSKVIEAETLLANCLVGKSSSFYAA